MNEYLKSFLNNSIKNMQNNVAEMESVKQKMENLEFDSVEETNIDSNIPINIDIEMDFGAKPKTIKYIDKFIDNELFVALDKDKQDAIISLKYIKAETMPDNFENTHNLDNLSIHFSSKNDKKQREKYAHLFNITKERPDIKLEVEKNEQQRIEYIKAFEYKQSKDLYYIAITQENDNINITGIPTTQILQIVKDIVRSKKVVTIARNFEAISNPAEPNIDISKPQLSDETIPQDSLNEAETKEQGDNLKDSNESNQTIFKR